MQSLFCAVFCYVAVISGLIVTLAGLALHKAALPALPVSIATEGHHLRRDIKFLVEPFLAYEFGRDAMESIPDDYNPGMSSTSSMSSSSSSSSYSLLGQSYSLIGLCIKEESFEQSVVVLSSLFHEVPRTFDSIKKYCTDN